VAIVNYIISNAITPTWGGTIDVSSLDDIISSSLPTVITAGSGLITFFPSSFGYYPDTDGNGNEYVTWRTYSGSSQYPDSGYSFDIWSTTLFNAINFGATWNTLIATGSYSLNISKHTLIYNYDAPFAPFYGIAGTITFS
jgi:hypothetical protein